MTQPLEIQWPDRYQPGNDYPVHVINEMDLAAPPEHVWAWLIRAPWWPTWYCNAKNVRILDEPGPDLQQGTRFRWTTFDLPIRSTVREYGPKARIAWDAHAFGFDAYHAWLLQPSARGCRVRTEEKQYGWLAKLHQRCKPGRMHAGHEAWLKGLEAKARAGLPPVTRPESAC